MSANSYTAKDAETLRAAAKIARESYQMTASKPRTPNVEAPLVQVRCGGCRRSGWTINWNRQRFVGYICRCGWLTHKDTA